MFRSYPTVCKLISVWLWLWSSFPPFQFAWFAQHVEEGSQEGCWEGCWLSGQRQAAHVPACKPDHQQQQQHLARFIWAMNWLMENASNWCQPSSQANRDCCQVEESVTWPFEIQRCCQLFRLNPPCVRQIRWLRTHLSVHFRWQKTEIKYICHYFQPPFSSYGC